MKKKYFIKLFSEILYNEVDKEFPTNKNSEKGKAILLINKAIDFIEKYYEEVS